MFEEPSNILAACVLGLLFILVVWLVGAQRKSPLSRLPHPPGWPLVGNAFQMTSHGRSDQQLELWAKQYGPVFTVQIFNMTWVVVSGYDELYEALIKKSRTFSGRYSWFRIGLIVFNDSDISLGNPSMPQWLPMRKALHRTIQPIGDNMNRIESVLIEMTQQLVVKVRSYDGREVDLREDLHAFVIKVAIAMLIGQNVDDDDVLFVEMKKYDYLARETLSSIRGVELDFCPWLRYFGHPTWKMLQTLIKLRDSLWELSVQAASISYSQDKRASCIVHALIEMFDQNSPFYEPTMTREHAIGLFIDVVGASIITTTCTAYTLINQLIHNPRVYKCLQHETDTVVGRIRLPNISDRDALPYTTATIFEILRLNSTLPTLFPHMTLEDTTLGKYHIPANTIVMPLVCYLHHDKSFWRDPLVFRPERFLDDSGKLVPPEHPNRKHLMSFGTGTRECPGELFALRRLFLFITSMVQAFDLEPGDVKVSCDPADYEDGLLVTQKPFKVRMIPRKFD